MTSESVTSRPDLLRIAFCLPELKWLQPSTDRERAEAAYIQQNYIATGLSARGHSLTLIAPSDPSKAMYWGDLKRFQPAPRTWSRSRLFIAATKTAWRIQQVLGVPYLNVFSNYNYFDSCLRCLPGHDLVYERNGLYNAGVAMACKRLGLPYVMFFDADQIAEHDFMEQPMTGLLRRRAQQVLRYNLGAARCVICVSEPAKANLVENWHVPTEKVVVFPNGVDVNLFQPDLEQRSKTRCSLGIESNPTVIFVGSFYPWHDVVTLLEAFALALQKHPTARLVLVGDGPQRQLMMQHVAEVGISDAVTFTGVVAHDDVPKLVNAADIAVAPYPAMERDLWLSPMKLFEYMALGTAIIASKTGQMVEVIQDGRNGLLVRPGDAPSMAAALVRLLDRESLRLQLGRQARADAIQEHSWERYLSRLERVFAAVIERQIPSQSAIQQPQSGASASLRH